MHKKQSQQVRARRRQLHDAQAGEYKASMKASTMPSSAFTKLTDPIKFGLETSRAARKRQEAEQAFLNALKGKS